MNSFYPRCYDLTTPAQAQTEQSHIDLFFCVLGVRSFSVLPLGLCLHIRPKPAARNPNTSTPNLTKKGHEAGLILLLFVSVYKVPF